MQVKTADLQEKSTVKLSDLQQQVKEQVTSNILSGKQEVSIAGLAGTGKSTISVEIAKELEAKGLKVVAVCPTGKAANVLRTKGRKKKVNALILADTIHSLIYTFNGTYVDKRSGNEVPIFNQKEMLERKPDVLLIDEASMVNSDLANDIRIHDDAQIIWVGDHGQLPPVGADPGIMRNPDYTLQEIFRQKGNSDIIDFAYTVRDTGHPIQTGEVEVLPFNSRNMVRPEYDQAICGYNGTRVQYNWQYRRMKKMLKYQVIEGERLICLKNNRRAGLFNGMQFIVDEVISEDDVWVEVKMHEEGSTNHWESCYLLKQAFYYINERRSGKKWDDEKISKEMSGKTWMIADYAYCITCHKSQGSEWDNVLVLNQKCSVWDQRRWLYTAATRASKRLTVMN